MTVRDTLLGTSLDKGEIVEQGSHSELLEKQGQYYRLWEMQQGNFVIKEEQNDQSESKIEGQVAGEDITDTDIEESEDVISYT